MGSRPHIVRSVLGSFRMSLAKEPSEISLFKILLIPANRMAVLQQGTQYRTHMARVVT